MIVATLKRDQRGGVLVQLQSCSRCNASKFYHDHRFCHCEKALTSITFVVHSLGLPGFALSFLHWLRRNLCVATPKRSWWLLSLQTSSTMNPGKQDAIRCCKMGTPNLWSHLATWRFSFDFQGWNFVHSQVCPIGQASSDEGWHGFDWSIEVQTQWSWMAQLVPFGDFLCWAMLCRNQIWLVLWLVYECIMIGFTILEDHRYHWLWGITWSLVDFACESSFAAPGCTKWDSDALDALWFQWLCDMNHDIHHQHQHPDTIKKLSYPFRCSTSCRGSRFFAKHETLNPKNLHLKTARGGKTQALTVLNIAFI